MVNAAEGVEGHSETLWYYACNDFWSKTLWYYACNDFETENALVLLL